MNVKKCGSFLKGEIQMRLIVLWDSGDTIVDESSEVRLDGSAVVERACLVPGMQELLLRLQARGCRMALVADGLVESFERVYRQHGLDAVFEARAISEEVGAEKPAAAMFEAALTRLHLTEADKPRMVMVGNNLKRDVVGAKRFGICVVHLAWTPRYPNIPETPEEVPDYQVQSPAELETLLFKLEQTLECT